MGSFPETCNNNIIYNIYRALIPNGPMVQNGPKSEVIMLWIHLNSDSKVDIYQLIGIKLKNNPNNK